MLKIFKFNLVLTLYSSLWATNAATKQKWLPITHDKFGQMHLKIFQTEKFVFEFKFTEVHFPDSNWRDDSTDLG